MHWLSTRPNDVLASPQPPVWLNQHHVPQSHHYLESPATCCLDLTIRLVRPDHVKATTDHEFERPNNMLATPNHELVRPNQLGLSDKITNWWALTTSWWDEKKRWTDRTTCWWAPTLSWWDPNHLFDAGHHVPQSRHYLARPATCWRDSNKR